MSTSQPYYWKSRKAWYLMTKSPNGKRSQVKLGNTRKEAFEKFAQIKDARSLSNPLALSLMDEWLGKLAIELESGLISKSRFENLARSAPLMVVENPSYTWKDINPETVLAWTVSKGWRPDTAATRIGYLKQWAKWVAKKHGLTNYIEDMRKPSSSPRKRVVSESEHRAMVRKAQSAKIRVDRRFGLYLTAMYHTGARPSEIARLKPSDIQGDVITLRKHKTAKKTGKARTIYLSGCALTAVKLGMACNQSRVFTGRTGGLKRNSVRLRIASLRKSCGLEPGIVAYSYRHAYATQALGNGVPIATLAELMGTSVAMISKHYGHLERNQEHLRKAAAMVRRGREF